MPSKYLSALLLPTSCESHIGWCHQIGMPDNILQPPATPGWCSSETVGCSPPAPGVQRAACSGQLCALLVLIDFTKSNHSKLVHLGNF